MIKRHHVDDHSWSIWKAQSIDRPPSGLVNTIYPLSTAMENALREDTEVKLRGRFKEIQTSTGRSICYAVAYARANGLAYSITPEKIGWKFKLED